MKAFTILLFACSLAASTYAQDTYKLTGELTADSRKAVKQLFLMKTSWATPSSWTLPR